ncbi:(d)CMP kinase [Salinibacillus xinjiangensis]|uniref:Cytidylate kinase n=1 Tax=Salinibacillus xinjiangensis TaxID=1229268 RepID=A0A6G1X6B3_9BACI|nr:(d)CMP kinase [Salinibacillus xinjiangensis]MRG86420.1 (d)CMP kinase [Salinibacillus xinjiangensis]
MKKDIAIAIDGPAAAGKSTVAKKVAKHLGYVYIDTGAMYRSLTLKALEKQIDVQDESKLVKLLIDTEIQFSHHGDQQIVLLDEKNVTNDIRSQAVTNNVSDVSKHEGVRTEMVKRQQEMAQSRRVVMDGRDIGTHVIPDAEVKVFLVASVEERAMRRHKENEEKGFSSDFEQLKKEIEKRDQIDSERAASPLVKADDAVEIDTTSYSIDEVTNQILTLVENQMEN